MCISESNSDFRMLLSFRSVSSPHSEAVFKATHWKKKFILFFLCCFHPTLCVRLVVLSAALFIHDDFEANVNELIWTHRPKVTDSIYCVVFSLSHVLCVAVAAFNLIRLLFSFCCCWSAPSEDVSVCVFVWKNDRMLSHFPGDMAIAPFHLNRFNQVLCYWNCISSIPIKTNWYRGVQP